VSALPPKPGESSTPASTLPGTTAPGPTPTGTAVRSLNEILLPLPVGIDLLKAGQLNVAGIEAANTWLASTFVNRPVSMRMALEAAQAFTEEGYAFKAIGKSVPVTSRGVTIPAQLVAQFRAGPAAALATVSKGRELPVRGVIQKVVIEGRGRSIVLTVTVAEAQTP
jgi:hypothetical protein